MKIVFERVVFFVGKEYIIYRIYEEVRNVWVDEKCVGIVKFIVVILVVEGLERYKNYIFFLNYYDGIWIFGVKVKIIDVNVNGCLIDLE